MVSVNRTAIVRSAACQLVSEGHQLIERVRVTHISVKRTAIVEAQRVSERHQLRE